MLVYGVEYGTASIEVALGLTSAWNGLFPLLFIISTTPVVTQGIFYFYCRTTPLKF
jgi:hypothetical protein